MGFPFSYLSLVTRLNDSRYGFLTRKGAGPDCFEVGRATVPLPPPSITMATMEKTSSVQVNPFLLRNCRILIPIYYLLRCNLLLLCCSGQDGTLQSFSTVHERFNKNLGHGRWSIRIRPRDLVHQKSCSCVSLIKAAVCFGSGSINKKKEKKKKKGLSYEELRLPAITAFTSGGTQTEATQNSPGNVYFLKKNLDMRLWQRLLVSQTGTGSSPVTVAAR